MTVYIGIAVLSVFLCALDNKFKITLYVLQKKRTLALFWIIEIVIVFAFAFFRSESIGLDLINYKNYFYDYLLTQHKIYEPAFTALTWGVQKFTDSFRMFMIVCSVLTLAPIFYTVNREVDRFRWFAVEWIIVFFLVSSFSILRASIAVAFMFLAYRNIKYKNRKYILTKKFWILMLVSILFHYSMILFLLLFCIAAKINSWRMYLLGIASAGILFFPITPYLITNIIASIRDRYSVYVTTARGDISLGYLVIFGSAFVISSLFYKNEIKKNKVHIIYNLNFGLLCFTLGAGWFPAYSRVLLAGLPIIAILMAYILQITKKLHSRIIIIIYWQLIFIGYWLLNITSNSYYSFMNFT